MAGDNCECGSDRKIVLADIFDGPLPQNALAANFTVDSRAAILLEYAVCEAKSVIFAPEFAFDTQLQAWGRDALAQLAYTGDCAGKNAATRYQSVDARLAQISVASDHFLGTDVPPENVHGANVVRRGDLDTGLKELIPIVFLYKDKIPVSYSHLVDVLRHAYPSNLPIVSTPPVFDLPFASGGSSPTPPGIAVSPETENHTLLILSEQYLVNQLLQRENSGVHDYLMKMMKGILTSDFFEYNSRPYQSYALDAMENLADFASDTDIKTSATMVLDFAAAKFVVSSSLLRRSSPFRRRASHDGNLFTGSDADDQLCRFFLYSGQLQTTFQGGHYEVSSGCMNAFREAIGTYRVPNLILDLAINKDAPYFQTFSGGANYYANLFGPDANFGQPVLGPVEIYDQEGPFFIAAGGIPQPNGLPLHIVGTLDSTALGLANYFGADTGCKGPNDACYSTDLDDVGVALQTLLIPNDPPIDSARPPLVDRRQLVRIKGGGYSSANLCVAPGFACGVNPVIPYGTPQCSGNPIPPCVQVDGPWQFVVLLSMPVNTFVAMLAEPASLVSDQILREHGCLAQSQWPFTIGLLEAAPASKFASFSDFQHQVKSNNPQGAALLVEQDGFTSRNPPFFNLLQLCHPPTTLFPPQGTYLVAFWKGHYKKTDGTTLDFTINLPESAGVVIDRLYNESIVTPLLPPSSADYPVQSANLRLPNVNVSTWGLGDGPIEANHTGVVVITNPRTGSSCQLDITDIHHPYRGCVSSVRLNNSGFITQSTTGKNGNFEIVVPESGHLAHYWRDNDAPGFPWHQGDDVVSYGVIPGVGSATVNGATLLESVQGFLWVVAWVHQTSQEVVLGGGPRAGSADILVSSWWNHRTHKWSDPQQIVADGKLVVGVTGPK